MLAETPSPLRESFAFVAFGIIQCTYIHTYYLYFKLLIACYFQLIPNSSAYTANPGPRYCLYVSTSLLPLCHAFAAASVLGFCCSLRVKALLLPVSGRGRSKGPRAFDAGLLGSFIVLLQIFNFHLHLHPYLLHPISIFFVRYFMACI